MLNSLVNENLYVIPIFSLATDIYRIYRKSSINIKFKKRDHKVHHKRRCEYVAIENGLGVEKNIMERLEVILKGKKNLKELKEVFVIKDKHIAYLEARLEE